MLLLQIWTIVLEWNQKKGESWTATCSELKVMNPIIWQRLVPTLQTNKQDPPPPTESENTTVAEFKNNKNTKIFSKTGSQVLFQVYDLWWNYQDNGNDRLSTRSFNHCCPCANTAWSAVVYMVTHVNGHHMSWHWGKTEQFAQDCNKNGRTDRWCTGAARRWIIAARQTGANQISSHNF